MDQLQLLLTGKLLDLRFALKSARSTGQGLLIDKFNRSLVLGVECAFLSIMLFETAGDISSNAGIKGFIPALHYVERPRHRSRIKRLRKSLFFSGLRSCALNNNPCSISDDRLWV